MKTDVYKVLVAQFLTAFADNAILFTAVTMVMRAADAPGWYVPAMQGAFLIAFVLLAPWVGSYADNRPKAAVMTRANVIKAVGASLMLFTVEPIIAYAVVGLGAAMYGPAKYGILPELVPEEALVKANGWIEGSTILAILTGMLAGAAVAERSIATALIMVVVLYALSALIALFISRTVGKRSQQGPAVAAFVGRVRGLLSTPRARFATLGVSLFWAAATVLRVLLVAFVPAVFLITESTKVAELSMFVALGIAVGSLLAAKLIPLAYLRRARMAAYFMGAAVFALSGADSLWLARVLLFLAGLTGGLFVVPINAALQEIGHKTIGSGGAVAVQNFFQSFAMLLSSGIYALAAGWGAPPVSTMAVLGVFIVVATVLVSLRLPPDTDTGDEIAVEEQA